jgi:Mn-containing catalase
MFKYVKHLAYPINIRKKDLKMAKLLVTQFGGSSGELGAAIRIFFSKNIQCQMHMDVLC